MNAFDRIRERLPMTVVAERYGFPVKRGHMLCPFHTENTPSLKLYPGDRGWWCFGCGSGGSVIDFAALLFGLTPLEAAKRLDADFCLGLLHDPPDPREVKRQRDERKRREAEKRRRELLWRRNRDFYRETVHLMHDSVPGPERAALMASLAHMDHWFENYERELKEGRMKKNCNHLNLHTQRKIS